MIRYWTRLSILLCFQTSELSHSSRVQYPDSLCSHRSHQRSKNRIEHSHGYEMLLESRSLLLSKSTILLHQLYQLDLQREFSLSGMSSLQDPLDKTLLEAYHLSLPTILSHTLLELLASQDLILFVLPLQFFTFLCCLFTKMHYSYTKLNTCIYIYQVFVVVHVFRVVYFNFLLAIYQYCSIRCA